ncbi:MAG: hypothetical protein IPP33_11890 [Flavobacteriales bacterium]|nr:hypothetical protein [Flavobacteriales bacterium]
MRTLSFLILFISFAFTVSAQTASEKADKINLFVGIVPGTNEELDQVQQDKLRNKITQCASRTGIVSISVSNFLLAPNLEVQEVNPVQGMKITYVVKCEVTLGISRTDYKSFPGQAFGMMTLPLTGAGGDKAQAITNAIQQINTSDK